MDGISSANIVGPVDAVFHGALDSFHSIPPLKDRVCELFPVSVPDLRDVYYLAGEIDPSRGWAGGLRWVGLDKGPRDMLSS